MKNIDLSIIVLNYRTLQLTGSCLESIYTSKTHYSYEVLVLDNDSRDGSADLLKKKYPRITLFKENKNYGFARGNNIAAKKARGKYILFLNSDTKLFSDTLEKAMTHICASKNVGVLGVRLLNNDGTVQPSIFRFPSLRLFLAELLFLPTVRFFDDYRFFHYDRERRVDFVSGAFMLIPRSVFQRVQGFDERFFYVCGRNGFMPAYNPCRVYGTLFSLCQIDSLRRRQRRATPVGRYVSSQ